MFIEVLLGDLDIHFGSVFLEAEIRVFFEPPGCNLAFANAT
jgi:hypothetical protein